MLSVSSLTIEIGPRALVKDASFTIGPGEKVGLVGRNGTGKSSLVSVLVGEARRTSARVRLGPARRQCRLPAADAGAAWTRDRADRLLSRLVRQGPRHPRRRRSFEARDAMAKRPRTCPHRHVQRAGGEVRSPRRVRGRGGDVPVGGRSRSRRGDAPRGSRRPVRRATPARGPGPGAVRRARTCSCSTSPRTISTVPPSAGSWRSSNDSPARSCS